jgi:hypothetical protein
MKKTLALLLVASLLLAGCTELASSDDDDEVKKIEVNEDIAIEKINDLITVEEDESFGITMMYDMDPRMMDDGGMLEFDEDSDAMMTIEMTEAWSPDGFHSSMVMGLTENGATMKMTQSFTHIDTTIYTSIGYETIGDVCANEDTPEETETCEMQVESIPATQFYSMEAANTHTQLIAAMAEETSDNSDDFDVNGFLEFLEGVENYGEFTATGETVDGLQVFDMTFDMDAMMADEAPTPEEALEMCDADNSGGISWDEFIAEDCDDTDPSMTSTDEGLWLGFSSADTDGSEELTVDELPAFITAVTAFYEGGDDYEEMSEEMEMPGMKVAFNSAGEIEYFEMQMDEMGDEIVTMKMYVLSEDKVASFFTDVDAGELVALPFEISSDLDPWASDEYFVCDDGMMIPMSYVNDGYEDCADGEDEMDMNDDHDDHDHGDHGDDHDDHDHGDHGDDDGDHDDHDHGDHGDDHDDHDHGDHGDDHDDHHDDEFTCDDGETIPMYWVNDGEEDCVGGEDEGYVWTYNYDNCADSDDGLSSLDCWTNEMDVDGDGTPEDSDSYWNYECEQLTDGTWECGTDHINYYDNCAYEGEDYYECWLDEWDTDNNGSYDLGSDGYMDDECEQLADGRWACVHSYDMEVYQNYDHCDENIDMIECWNDDWVDSDGDVVITDTYELGDCSELADGSWECLIMNVEDGWPTFICGNGEEIPFDYVNDGGADCTDGADEQQYDSDGNEINWFDCMDGTQIWIYQVNDGYEDCQDGEDEMPDMDDDHDDHDHGDHGDDHDDHDHGDHGDDHDDHDHGDHGDDSDEIVMYITSDMDFHFEGDISDYKIVLATCDEDYDSDTEEWITTCSTVVSVQIADATADSDIVFHDADNSGTISDGDMIHIGETSEEWNTVRLYSVSADAYSDENPMLTVPGFTGLVGMLALLGAAFIRRNE